LAESTVLAVLFPALAVKIEGVVHHFKVEDIAHHGFDLLYAGVAKFEHMATVQADEVVVLLKAVSPLILCQILAKLVLGDKVAAYQELKGIVDGSPGYTIILVFHVYVKGFGIKVITTAVNLLEDGISFRGLAECKLFKM